MNEETLTAIYVQWLKDNKYPDWSAEELVYDLSRSNSAPEQHVKILNAFIDLWEAVVE